MNTPHPPASPDPPASPASHVPPASPAHPAPPDSLAPPPDGRLIDFCRDVKIRNPLLRGAWRLMARPLEKFLGIPRLNDRYLDLLRNQQAGMDFFPAVLRTLDFGYTVSDADLARIPRTGPVFVVSNHPTGGADGIILAAMLQQARPDLKLLANSLLLRMKGIAPWLFPVNPFGGAQAARDNLNSMRAALRHLADGGCVATFPSGEVAHFRWSDRGITDPPWKTHIARMVRSAGATVLPVFIHGGNSLLFQTLGLVSARARTALLGRELVNKRGKQIRIRIGNPIPFAKLKHFASDEAMTEFMRLGTYALHDAARNEPEDAAHTLKKVLSGQTSPASLFRPLLPADKHAPGQAQTQTPPPQEPIIPPVPPHLVQNEIEKLPPESRVAGNDTFSVHLFHGARLPNTLREIGRLREVTFRDVGEGTGKSCDLDKFDRHYDHLVLYDTKARLIAGAYRLGRTDEILEKYGKRGLYTSTLFHFHPGFFIKLSPAIELGRSFIRAEYQRHPAGMFMLWRGITAYILRYPHCTKLFGPVSINPMYHAFSRHLILEFLKKNSIAADLCGHVSARNPPRAINLRGVDLMRLLETNIDMDDLSTLVSGLESDGKPLPVLLKHYMKLNGRLISFNVDADFGKCLDGLIVVDILKIPTRTLKNYMSPTGADGYLRFHGQAAKAA